MNSLRTVLAFIIVVAIILLGIFYNDIKGYEKIERINEWVLYYCEKCDQSESEYDGYILVNGFAELPFDEALETEYFSDEIEQEIISIIESRE